MKDKNSIGLFIAIAYSFGLIAALKISPEGSELIIRKNHVLTLNCTDDGLVRWLSPDWPKYPNEKIENGANFSKLVIDSANYLDTGYYTCQSERNASDIARIYVYCFDENNAMTANTSSVDVTVYRKAVIPCRPTSPNITMVLTKMDNTIVEPIEKYDPKIGFVVSTYHIINSADFRCVALDYYHRFKVTVNVHPPQNDSTEPLVEVTDSKFRFPILEGQNALLNCSVITSSGLEIESIKWNFPKHVEEKITKENISKITHDDFNTFFQIFQIHNLSKIDEGNYTCRIIDSNSNTKKFTHELSVYESNSTFLNMKIREESRNLTVRAGVNRTVKFIASVQCFPKCQSTWYNQRNYNIRNMLIYYRNDRYRIIENENEVKLEIKHIIIQDFGTYQIRISNPFHTRTENFSLIVEASPEINLQDSEAKLYKLNTSIQHECSITGYPPPQISWNYKKCNNYPRCEDKIFKPLPASLIIHEETVITDGYNVMSKLHFEPKHSMMIQCEANNSFGSANDESPFLLTEYNDTKINVIMIKNYFEPISIGDDIEITCAVSKYYFKNEFSWAYASVINSTHVSKKVSISPSQGIQIKNWESNFSYVTTLFIANIQKNQSGIYSCRIFRENSLDILSKKNADFTKITVHEMTKPRIVHSHMNHGLWQVNPATNIGIIIRIDGNPLPSVVWYKDNKPLSLNDRIVFTTQNGMGNLSIFNISLEDEGIYTFVASNKAGNVSDSLQLSIKNNGTKENHPSNNEHFLTGAVMFGFSALVSFVFFILYTVKIRQEKKKMEQKMENFNMNILTKPFPELKPGIDVGQQTSAIPYNNRYEFPRDKLKLDKELGSGAFGIVYKATAYDIIQKYVKTTVAVKEARNPKDPHCIYALDSEMKIMIYLGKHVNVVNLLGACTRREVISGKENVIVKQVIVEYCRYGNTRDLLRKHRNQFVNQIINKDEIDFTITSTNINVRIPQIERESQRKNCITEEELPEIVDSNDQLISCEWKEEDVKSLSKKVADSNDDVLIKTIDLISWSFQVARGMEYLSGYNPYVLHGDLAARNVLLAENNIIKIGDFGFSKRLLQEKDYQTRKTTLPITWMSPEAIRNRIFSAKSDVWAFGITMWEFFSLADSPFDDLGIAEILQLLDSGHRLKKPTFATDHIYNLMESCWGHEPSSRPSFKELRENLGQLLEALILSRYDDLNKSNEGDAVHIQNAETYLRILNSSVPEPIQHHASTSSEPICLNTTPEQTSFPGYQNVIPIHRAPVKFTMENIPEGGSVL